MKRKGVGLLAGLMLAALMLSSCAPLVEDAPDALDIYATFYPIYALTEAVAGGVPDIELHCLVQPQDGCLRNYQLSDWDIYLLASSADAVVMGGRGLESFESTLLGWGESGPALSAVLYNLDLYNDSRSHGGETESHLEGPNPHLYMSVDGAKAIVESLSAAMMTLDPRYAQNYLDNETAALEHLDALKARMEALTDSIKDRKVVLMNECLIYPARDYGLEVADQIDRESGQGLYGTELDDCLDKIEASGAQVVLIERQAPAALVDALRDAGYQVALMDVMSTHMASDGFDGYLEAMLRNAEAVRAAFESIQ